MSDIWVVCVNINKCLKTCNIICNPVPADDSSNMLRLFQKKKEGGQNGSCDISCYK